MKAKVLSILLFGLVAGFTFTASAQTIGFAEAIDRLAAACGADIKKHCKGVPLGDGGVRNCLVRNQAKNAPRCNSTMAEVFRLIEIRLAAQAAVPRICDADIRRLCQGVQPGDGNLLECGLKARRAVSAKCNQAITDAGWR
jgi:hypothetical protein